MKKIFCIVTLIIATLSVNAIAQEKLTAEQILKKIDEKMIFETARVEARMVIVTGDTTRTLYMNSVGKGRDLALMEFTAPAREKGTKFLRREKTMWLYFPRADRVRQIKGHMLRQGMMGSDFSYEDASDNDSVLDHYSATIVSEEKYENRDVWVLDLLAKDKEVTYQHRKIWVDKNWFVPLKEELYAKSGLLLKELTMSNVKLIAGRYYPTRWKMLNKLTSDSSTELIMDKIEHNIKIDDSIFSLANLKKR